MATQSFSASITIYDDMIFEKDQTFTVSVSSETNVNIDVASHMVTIVDDEGKENWYTMKPELNDHLYSETTCL